MQKPDAFEVKADLPGVKEENVKVTVDGDVLSLAVEGQDDKDEIVEEVRLIPSYSVRNRV